MPRISFDATTAVLSDSQGEMCAIYASMYSAANPRATSTATTAVLFEVGSLFFVVF